MNTRTYRVVDGTQIDGQIFHAFRFNHHYYFVEVIVYADGVINCWEDFTLEEFKTALHSEKIMVEVPSGTTIRFEQLGQLTVQDFLLNKSVDDFIKEIEDSIEELNGRKGRISKCIDAYEDYLISGDQKSLDALSLLFEDLPAHQRVLFEISRDKDPLIELMQNKKIETEEIRKGILEDYFNENEESGPN